MNLEDLSHKKKTVADLIRFIGNTAEISNEPTRMKAPNYSILLGAGASVTSGIRSGQELINTWKKEVYDESDHPSDINVEDFFLSSSAPDWYDGSNAYSSLFENRYDLQRHRRMFVEHEVAGKTPSIGYAYLVKLIENGFFNTVFTTNFDDLLNESFYRFSKNRPIVCAHDSSISGITVTSLRPKIIKLHGDYLFDGIKATLRETESLEANMKKKFQEFAKDFGLIVVGYAGHDRSIMDILTYLLQQEDYFKNGIYWCLRKEDKTISPELKRLLWRDRVFYVEIEGFDELFAELNHSLNNGALPIDDTFLSRAHQESIIKDLTENSSIKQKSSSPYLLDDCKKLKEHFEDNMAIDYISYIRNKKSEPSKKNEYKRAQRKSNYPEMEPKQKKELNDLLSEAFALGHKESVLHKLETKDLFSLESSRYKLELLELQADLTNNMDDQMVCKFFDELIKLDDENERYYEIASNRSTSQEQAIRYLELASNKFNNDYYIINLYLSRLLDFCEDQIDISKIEEELKIIDKNIHRSLKLYPWIDNKSYSLLLRYYMLIYNNQIDKLKGNETDLCNKVYDLCKYHPQTLSILKDSNSDKLTEGLIKESIKFYTRADNTKLVEKTYIALIKWYIDKDNFSKALETIKEFEQSYIGSDFYKLEKATVLVKYEYYEDALNLLNSLKSNEDAIDKKMMIYSTLKMNKELEDLYNSLENKQEYTANYLEYSQQYEELTKYYKSLVDNGRPLTKEILSSYTYAMLQVNDFKGVVSLLKQYYENPAFSDAQIIINYLYALQQTGENVDKRIRNKIIDQKFIQIEDVEMLGAYCVLRNEEQIFSYLNKVVKKTPVFKTSIMHWPIIRPYKDKDRFKKVLAIKNNHLSE